MHGRRALLLLLAVGLVPLSGCIGVDNMSELRRQVTGDVQQPVLETPAEDPANLPPRPAIAVERTEARPGQALTFDGSGSTDPDGRVVAWRWAVDGEPAGASPRLVHAFEDPGTHLVRLTVEDDRGGTAEASVDVRVRPDEPPRAEMSVTEAAGSDEEEGPDGAAAPAPGPEVHRTRVGQRLRLSAEASHDPEGGPLAFAWDLGDGTTSADMTLHHAFAEGGRYEVRLIVQDAAGATDEAVRVLAVDAEGRSEGTVTLDAPARRVEVPVRAGAREVVVTLTYAADLPLEDLDLTLLGPGGAGHAAPDGEGVLPGTRTVAVAVQDPAEGAWTAEVALDVGLEADFTVAWVVRY